MLVANGQKFNDLSEYSATICIYQAGDDFIRNVASRSPQHFFKLRSGEALDNDILLSLFCFVFSLELKTVVLILAFRGIDFRKIRVHILFSQVDVL